MAAIIVGSGPMEGVYLPLRHKTAIVGRGEAVDLQIVEDSISRKHLRIQFDTDEERYVALDMGSRNGSWINGQPLKNETFLQPDDEIVVGNTKLLFSVTVPKDKANALEIYQSAGQRRYSTRRV